MAITEASLMFYDFRCRKCETVFEISKNPNELEEHETCPECLSHDTHQVFSCKIKMSVCGQHPGLGVYIKDSKQLTQELNSRGLIEVGNECKVQKAPKRKSVLDSKEKVQEFRQKGANISDREVDAIRSGKDISKS